MASVPRRHALSTSHADRSSITSIHAAFRTRSKTFSPGSNPNSVGGGLPPLHHLPGSSWFCCKFWKRKTSAEVTSANASTRSPSLSISSDVVRNSSSSGAKQHRPRGHSFYKNLIKRSRTDGLENSSQSVGEEQGFISGELTANSEEEVDRLLAVIARLVEKLNDQPEDIPALGDEECVICATSRASMQTFPCGHKVLCKMCFIRTIELALQERQLPLRCVVCRSRVVRLKQQSAACPVVILQQREPPGSYFVPQVPSPLPPSGVRRPGYM